MSDPLNPWEDSDRLHPAGDLNPDTPDLTGTINTVGGGLGDAVLSPDTAEREAADAQQAAAGGVGDTGPAPAPGGTADADPAPDANDLEADNEVERETIETVDPANPPA